MYEKKYPTPEEFQAWLEELPKWRREAAERMLEESRKPVTGARLAEIVYIVDF